MHVPGWHEAVRSLQDEGRVQLVGIVQEQHPDRARLFMQWKRMDWPVMVDAQNQLGVAVVPITAFIDEHGIIRDMRPRRREIKETVERFLARTYEAPAEDEMSTPPARPDLAELREAADSDRSVKALRRYARALVNWGGVERSAEAIEAFAAAAAQSPEDGLTQFQLGVAYRKRYDSDQGQLLDFQRAIDHWSAALALNPNQYIWRRRIQQYGPRLTKPYSFYDWVTEARSEIEARGETPLALTVEPSGAELAHPERSFSPAELSAAEPDPQGRIQRDRRQFILTEATVVPAAVRPGSTLRTHLVFRPHRRNRAHWNNEAEPMQVWIFPPTGWQADQRAHTIPNAPQAVSLETRRIEFELRVPEDAAAGTVRLPVYALYTVCEGPTGVCLYRRQDLEIDIRVEGGTE